MTFSELGLSAKVLAAIEASGYTTPTPIQAQAIPIAVTGRDVLGIAQTGTGKTASFVLPMLTRLETGRARARMPRSLILAPTRELAAQVADSFERYGVNHKLSVALLIGGVSFDDQNKKLDRGVDVLIATPGRLLDHFQRGRLLMTGVEILVIDEADRMLDMGFIPDIEKICSLLPPRRQTLFFSATMPPEIQRLVARFLNSPERVEAAPQSTTASTITQRFRFASPDAKQKRAALRDWIREEPVKNAIIFCNRKRDVDIVYKSLSVHGFNVGCLHGDMDQRNRTETLDAFRSGTISLLAASDVAARGLDIPEVSHVFNYDVPIVAEDYVHRIGRTGRAGRQGFSATLVTDDDMRTLRDIEKMLKAPVEWAGDPPPEDAGTKAGKRKRLAEAGAGRDDRRGDRRDGRRERGGRGGRDGERRPRREHAEHAPAMEASALTEPVAALPASDPVDMPAAAAPQPDVGAWPGIEAAPQAERVERPERSDRPQRGERSERGDRPRGERSRGGRGRSREDRGPGERSEPRRRREPAVESGGSIVEPQSAREDRPRRQPQQERGERVVGMGDHVPAFMRRPPRGTPSSSGQES
ncbi:MAG: DEAD/DEAH box helicase [Hyphomicrobiaceae bacterium]